jgi:hypothetical protein
MKKKKYVELKCPFCNEKISMLKNIQSGNVIYEFDGYDYFYNGFEDNGVVNQFCCPNCDEEFTTDEREAKKFLQTGKLKIKKAKK